MAQSLEIAPANSITPRATPSFAAAADPHTTTARADGRDGSAGLSVIQQEYQQEEMDHAMALRIQREWDTAALVSTPRGRAVTFVDKLGAAQRQWTAYDPDRPDWNGHNFRLVGAPDDVVYLTQLLLDKQEEFRMSGKPTHVDIGYHYTDTRNMPDIGTNGLMTRADRTAYGVRATFHGGTFGDGVYTGHNPYSYHKFQSGGQGLLVARLKGSIGPPPDPSQQGQQQHYDSVLGRTGESDEVCVLKTSDQVLALAQFHADMATLDQDDSVGNRLLHQYHCGLQAILDECFNGGRPTPVPHIVPSQVVRHDTQVTPVVLHISTERYEAPDTVLRHDHAEILQRELEEPQEICSPEDCPICLAAMTAEKGCCAVTLKQCGHWFHRSCIDQALQTNSYKCPVCRKQVGDAARGTMPSGILQIYHCPFQDCGQDYRGMGCYRLLYQMEGGVQKTYHPNPGVPYDAANRKAYIPKVPQGDDLLKRLKYAFQHGLTFTIGTSLTTGRPNRIVWASIQ
uniref:RING-type E3 ubiquitin transferase n=1 Tax=Amphora coffeiformis TaxID=265554 RepID=A0A7S3LBR7_9STRA